MISAQRLKFERLALDFGFPRRYVFHNLGSSSEWLEVGLRTNAGNTYRLRVLLDDFPIKCPKVFVFQPNNLKDYNGKLLKDYGASATMHLLSPDSQGNIRLCHYSPLNWHPNVTLYKVVLKCLIWLNCYDGHLSNGDPIDYYLKHQ